ncbi:MAG: winged helix-turn-helix transcriptional regulator [Elusimicrobia bacterium]|nr:winged helix-turn-helix transcriptional regulator [Elusimicrobiota bacterium]
MKNASQDARQAAPPGRPLAGGLPSEKEFILIRTIAGNPAATQRELSSEVGLSLGMTNLLIRRLARKGFLKTTQLTWNKARYILTPKGMMEKARKSFNYSAWALRHLKEVVGRMRQILLAEYRAGRREFHIVSREEGAELVQMALDEIDLAGSRIHRFSSIAEVPRQADAVFLATSERPPAAAKGPQSQQGAASKTRHVSLLDEGGGAP